MMKGVFLPPSLLPPFLQSDVDCSLNNLARSVARSLAFSWGIGPNERTTNLIVIPISSGRGRLCSRCRTAIAAPPQAGDLHCIGERDRVQMGMLTSSNIRVGFLQWHYYKDCSAQFISESIGPATAAKRLVAGSTRARNFLLSPLLSSPPPPPLPPLSALISGDLIEKCLCARTVLSLARPYDAPTSLAYFRR